MNLLLKPLTIGLGVVLLIGIIGILVSCQNNPETRQETGSSPTPIIGEPVTPGLSQDVKNLPTAEPWQPGDPTQEINPRQRPDLKTPDSTSTTE